MDLEKLVIVQKLFIEQELISKIIEENDDLRLLNLLKWCITQEESLNGFKSNIYLLKMEFEDPKTGKQTQLEIATKFLKGDYVAENEIQFKNEAYFYEKVLSSYLEHFQKQLKTFNTTNLCPRIYFSKTDQFESLGKEPQTILAMDNLLKLEYEMGPRVFLNEEHLRLMTKKIAQLHSFSIALKLSDRETLETLKSGIIQVSFKNEEKEDHRIRVLHELALKRLFYIISKRPEVLKDSKFANDLENLKNHIDDVLALLEKFLEVEEPFSVLLHGDYNRNNVMFKYDKTGKKDKLLIDMKMIDFQDIRYGTPAIDLAFFFYMNMTCEDREAGLFEKLLEFYHQVLIESICELLETEKSDPRFIQLSFENFQKHFRKFGFYGTMIALHFTPWMMTSEEECREMVTLFEKDIYSDELVKESLTFGGEITANRLVGIVKHVSRSGFMDILK